MVFLGQKVKAKKSLHAEHAFQVHPVINWVPSLLYIFAGTYKLATLFALTGLNMYIYICVHSM